jgi:hypothetical protein
MTYPLFHRALLTLHPGWVAELRFAPPRRWRFDFANVGQKLAIEIQGGIWTGGRHSRGGKAQLDEMEKLNAAALDRWCVLFFSPEQVGSGMALRVVQFFGRL